MGGPHELEVIVGAGPIAADRIRAAWDRGNAIRVDSEGAATPSGGPVDAGVIAHVRTSGTTGEPRVAALTRDGLQASASMLARALDASVDDPWLCCLPLSYVAGLAVVGRAWAMGAPVIVHEGFDVARVHEEIARGRVAFVSLVATALRRLLDAQAPLDRLRGILLGGGPIDAALVAEATECGISVHTTYGMTETWGGVVHDGHPLPGVDVRLAGTDDNDIEILTPSVMRGYVGDDAATRAAFTPDGWLRTGDIGSWNPDGTLAVVDRRKDIIISGGVNVVPSLVDTALRSLPDIADAAVIGERDPEWGERVVACVVPAPGCPPPGVPQLRAALRDALPPAALPREVRVVTNIPRSAGGKVLRRELRAQHGL